MYGGAKGIIVPFSSAFPGHMAEESHTSTHMLIAADESGRGDSQTQILV